MFVTIQRNYKKKQKIEKKLVNDFEQKVQLHFSNFRVLGVSGPYPPAAPEHEAIFLQIQGIRTELM